MPKIAAYKCPFTKKLFETRSGYRRHLLKLRVKKAAARARRKISREQHRIRKERQDRLRAKVAKIRTAADIEKFIVKNFRELMLEAHGRSAERMVLISQMEMKHFRFDRIHYSDEQSNTHNCPRSGETNWGGHKCDKGVPRGYPGFSGQMKWLVTGPNKAKNDGMFGLDVGPALKVLGVHTTSGCPGWAGDIGFQFFVDDFPGIKEEVAAKREEAKKEIFHARLKNGNRVYEKDIIVKHIRPVGITTKELDTA